MSDAPRCDRCKFYRPILAMYEAGDHVGECRPGPASFRGIAHQGEGFLSVWPHTRAHWECGAFQPADGPQPFAQPRDQPDNDPDARDFPLPGAEPDNQAPSAADETAAATSGPGDVEPSTTDAPTPPAGDGDTVSSEPDNTPTQADGPQAETPVQASLETSSGQPPAKPVRPVVRGNRR